MLTPTPAATRPRKRLWWRLLGRVLFYAVVLFAALPATFCHVLTRAPGGDGRSPGREFTQLLLEADGLRQRAWWRAGDPALPGFVIVHGLGDSPAGLRRQARRLGERGHSVLMPELRGHGEQRDPTTLGGRERAEVGAAIDELRRRQPGRVVLMGFSMGAVAALLAAADRDDVAAVIAEAPYDSYRGTVAHHAWLLYRIPGWVPLIPISVRLAEWHAGFDADAIDAVEAARRLRAPLLAIADGDDPRMPPEVVGRVFEAHPGPKRLWIAAGAGHVGAAGRPDYWPRVLGFLEEHGIRGHADAADTE